MSGQRTENFFDKVERAFDVRANEDAEAKRSQSGRVNKTPLEILRMVEKDLLARRQEEAKQMIDDLARFTTADLLSELSRRNDENESASNSD